MTRTAAPKLGVGIHPATAGSGHNTGVNALSHRAHTQQSLRTRARSTGQPSLWNLGKEIRRHRRKNQEHWLHNDRSLERLLMAPRIRQYRDRLRHRNVRLTAARLTWIHRTTAARLCGPLCASRPNTRTAQSDHPKAQKKCQEQMFEVGGQSAHDLSV